MVAVTQKEKARGYIYIWALFAVMLTGVMLAAAGQVWQTTALREKEAQLLFVGDQFRRAIESYYNHSGAGEGSSPYPESFEQLLEDKRGPAVKRHLRKIFIDPLTNSDDWGVIRLQDGGITGVYSRSAGKPFKRANFSKDYSAFEKAETYQDWKFGHALALAGEQDQAIEDISEDRAGFPTLLPGSAANPFAQGHSQQGDSPFSRSSEGQSSADPFAPK